MSLFSPKWKIIDGKLIKYLGKRKNVKLPNTVRIIGKSAFEHSDVVSVVLPETVKKIEVDAFKFCKELNYIKLPESLTQIESGAFFDCKKLEQVELPASLKKVDLSSTAISKIKLPESISSFRFSNCSKLSEINIPSSIKAIENGAFYLCKDLENIEIPKSVKKIGKEAFALSGLKKVFIPDSVETIEEQAFYRCEQLTSITCGKGLKTIKKEAFSWCQSLEKLIIKAENPPEIKPDAFETCKPAFNICLNSDQLEKYSVSKNWYMAKEMANANFELIDHLEDNMAQSSNELGFEFGDIIKDATSDIASLKHFISNNDINQKDRNGQTLLHFACNRSYDFLRGHLTIGALPKPVKLLLENGAIPNIKDKEGNTPLHIFAISGWSVEGEYLEDTEDILKLLKNFGADFKIRNIEGETASECANNSGQWGLSKLIDSYS